MAKYLKENLVDFKPGLHSAELNSAPVSILTDENISEYQKRHNDNETLNQCMNTIYIRFHLFIKAEHGMI